MLVFQTNEGFDNNKVIFYTLKDKLFFTKIDAAFLIDLKSDSKDQVLLIERLENNIDRQILYWIKILNENAI